MVPPSENDVGSFSTRSSRRFEADAGIAPDHDDSLSEQCRFATCGSGYDVNDVGLHR
jgi:hypothetical protein